ncbi:ATP-binding protein [Parvibaculum sp.]|uniref:ATP-binding protein n=1 Tax=Parvibaculum sp. TaxID=2024848 RepID=UPI00391C2A0E
MKASSTLIGSVQDVSGTSISVALVTDTVTGLSFHNGEAYRIGQVGSFVRIPLGYTSLFGLVSQVGAGAAPVREGAPAPESNQWLRVQLVGERGREGRFERGVSQHPTINDAVHIVTEADLRDIYGPGDPIDFVRVGHLASADSIPALVNINKLVTRHSAVVGTTGAGKSTTVAAILMALSNVDTYPSSRILLFDVHGEYGQALQSVATVLRIEPYLDRGELPLRVPYWALSFDELIRLTFGSLSDDHKAVVGDMIADRKRATFDAKPVPGLTRERISADTPIPFSIHKLWFDLHCREYQTVVPDPGGAADVVQPAYVLNPAGAPVQPGDAEQVIPPIYRMVKTTGPAAERVQWGPDPINLRREVGILGSRLRDPQLGFLFNPDEWRPNLAGEVHADIDTLLDPWLGNAKPLTILDLSGVPSSILNDLVGAVLRIVYDALFWANKLPEGGKERPLLCVLEEAHTYLSKGREGLASETVKRIAKEGRKYGVGMMLVSQRPSEIDTTILSQCGTIFAMRLANDVDRSQVSGAATDNLKGLFDMLPVLRTGEAIVVGEAVSLPIRVMVDSLSRERRPDSADPTVVVRSDVQGDGYEQEGGWTIPPITEKYDIVLRQWRSQSSRYVFVEGDGPIQEK